MLISSLLIAPIAQVEASAAVPAAAMPAAAVGVEPVRTDWSAQLTLHPAGFAAGGVGAQTMFSKKDVKSKRPVQLQVWNGATWDVVKTAKMAKSGLVEFKFTPVDGMSYRAVALKYKGKKVVGTPQVTMSYDFNQFLFDDGLGEAWSPWLDAGFGAKERHCAAPLAENAAAANGFAVLSVTHRTDLEAQAKAGKCSKANLKKDKVYGNAQVSTRTGFRVQSGIMEAKITFPKAKGMHAGVWLESDGPEIDMIEAYGAGQRITNVFHLSTKANKTTKWGNKENKLYSKKKSSSWYSKPHLVSLEWNSNHIVFRVDGKVTSAKKVWTPAMWYWLVMSNMTSDWELKNLKNSQLPTGMKVDWVRVWANK